MWTVGPERRLSSASGGWESEVPRSALKIDANS